MDRLIGWHLRRARQAGPRLLGQRTPVAPVVDDILLVLRWPLADRGMTADVDCPRTRPSRRTPGPGGDDRQPVRECRQMGRTRLRITVRTPPDRLILRIEDDGPGLPPDQAPLP
ncbi:hypothetical protein FLP41_09840 [Paracoccus marcusii]|uniref:hypothetical protein n=1 Tax=Paracoccus marcusii TaxID=59779 RepID=UPI002ED1F285|nr:hypothetical protein FLP41_09840 [Paracoccus marcusii]